MNPHPLHHVPGEHAGTLGRFAAGRRPTWGRGAVARLVGAAGVVACLTTGCFSHASAANEDSVDAWESSSRAQRSARDERQRLPSDFDAPAFFAAHPVTRVDRPVFVFAKYDASQQKDEEAPSFQFLPDERAGSRSVGTTTKGYVVHADELEAEGDGWRILTRQRARDLRYGSQEVVAILRDAGRAMRAKYPDSTVLVGNIGRPHGGGIRYSVSHNNGRDADIAFMATDPEGRPVDVPDLLVFNDQGVSRTYDGYYRFDAERNWALVRALLESDAASVQYLFISNGLKNILMRWARANGEPADMIAMADTVLRQPGVQSPHDDHLHLRIFCPAEDILAGCQDFGAMHAWAPARRVSTSDAVARASSYLSHDDPSVRIAAIDRLLLLEATEAAEGVVALLNDPAPSVRMAALHAIEALGVADALTPMLARLQDETDPEVLAALVSSLSRRGGDAVAEAMVPLIRLSESDPRASLPVGEPKPVELRLYAVDAAARCGSLAPVTALLELLSHGDGELRARANDALALVANRRVDDLDWRAPSLDPAQIDASIAAWQDWHRETVALRRSWNERALEGFREAGYETPSRPRDLAASLARAAGDTRPWVRINAQRMLMAMTNTQPASLEWSPADARAFWTRWTERNPRRIVALK